MIKIEDYVDYLEGMDKTDFYDVLKDLEENTIIDKFYSAWSLWKYYAQNSGYGIDWTSFRRNIIPFLVLNNKYDVYLCKNEYSYLQNGDDYIIVPKVSTDRAYRLINTCLTDKFIEDGRTEVPSKQDFIKNVFKLNKEGKAIKLNF